MSDVDRRVEAALETLTPPVGDPGSDWEGVVRDADARRRRGWLIRSAMAAAVVVAAVTAVLAWPSEGQRGGVLERALAAVGDGPVLHIVFAEEWGGTLVDVETGQRREQRAEREVWYDPTRGLRQISRLDGAVRGDVLYPPERIPRFERKTFDVLARGYREALESGRAGVLEKAVAYGVPVYWIRVDEEWLPDVADGKLHEWAHDVAVSGKKYEPVAIRETRDRKPGPPGTRARIVEFESLPAGEGNFDRPDPEPRLGGVMMTPGAGDPVTLEEAASVLGRPPVWLGPSFRGHPLTRVARTKWGVRPEDAVEWQITNGLDLVYGGGDGADPYVVVRQTPRSHSALLGGAQPPPEGTALLSGSSAFLRTNALVVRIASEEGSDVLVAAARALEPIPQGQ